MKLNANIEYMNINEFVKTGVLQELNRQFLHPLGLALMVNIGHDGEATLESIWDSRQDPEGIYFAFKPDPEKTAYVEELRKQHFDARCDLFGISEQDRGLLRNPDHQPLDWEPNG